MKGYQMGDFYQNKSDNWDILYQKLQLGDDIFRNGRWLFRGECQAGDDSASNEANLQTSLERACSESNIKRNNILKIEQEMIRDFRRKYDGNDRHDVENDILYCLSLIRHYGAPTRFLDWTYSPYVAAYFALEKWRRRDRPVVAVWCLETNWCYESAIEFNPSTKDNPGIKDDLDEYRKRHEKVQNDTETKSRKNELFDRLFMNNTYRFVYPVNPFHLHTRLSVQQGVFLCPGDVSINLMEILKTLPRCYEQTSIYKFVWKIEDKEERIKALDALHRMNVNRASLFPGLEGFAQSLNYRMRHYEDLAEREKAGKPIDEL